MFSIDCGNFKLLLILDRKLRIFIRDFAVPIRPDLLSQHLKQLKNLLWIQVFSIDCKNFKSFRSLDLKLQILIGDVADSQKH